MVEIKEQAVVDVAYQIAAIVEPLGHFEQQLALDVAMLLSDFRRAKLLLAEQEVAQERQRV